MKKFILSVLALFTSASIFASENGYVAKNVIILGKIKGIKGSYLFVKKGNKIFLIKRNGERKTKNAKGP